MRINDWAPSLSSMAISSRGFKSLDHTADAGLHIWGDTLSAIFEEGARALFSLMVDLNCVSKAKNFEMTLSADSGEELFMVWLKELLFFFDTKKILLSDFHILDLNPWTLKANVCGEPLNLGKHLLEKEVKAITRHQFEFKKTKKGFETKFIVDI